MCPHRGAVFSYTWRHVNYPFKDDDRVACNVFFTWEMMRPLLKGIPLYVIPDTVIYDPPLLMKFLHDNKITRVLLTPSLLGKLGLIEFFRFKCLFLCFADFQEKSSILLFLASFLSIDWFVETVIISSFSPDNPPLRI